MIKARFIHTHLKKNQLPTHWAYPQAGTFEGAQVLDAWKAIYMAFEGDRQDDWHHAEAYPYLAFFKVSGYSGDSGPLPYRAIKECDIEEMRVISIDDLYEAVTGIAEEMDAWEDEEPHLDLIIEDHIDLIFDKAEKVEPQFISTLP